MFKQSTTLSVTARGGSILFVLALFLSLAGGEVSACPSCKFSVPNDSGKRAFTSEQISQASIGASAGTGYNVSIVMMMAMPFVLGGSLGGFLYVAVRKQQSEQSSLKRFDV